MNILCSKVVIISSIILSVQFIFRKIQAKVGYFHQYKTYLYRIKSKI